MTKIRSKVLVGIIGGVLLSGCSFAPSASNPSQQTSSSVGTSDTIIQRTTTTNASLAYTLPTTVARSSGDGWSSAGVGGQLPISCHAIGGDTAFALPDPTCTPGAINTEVTQSNIQSTICSYGYTATVRPPVSVTEPLKYKLMFDYGYGGQSASDYELDHLIPLELGGASTVENLWPELDNHPSSYYLNSKDIVENTLHKEVCSGKITLEQAQAEIVTNWTKVLPITDITQ